MFAFAIAARFRVAETFRLIRLETLLYNLARAQPGECRLQSRVAIPSGSGQAIVSPCRAYRNRRADARSRDLPSAPALEIPRALRLAPQPSLFPDEKNC